VAVAEADLAVQMAAVAEADPAVQMADLPVIDLQVLVVGLLEECTEEPHSQCSYQLGQICIRLFHRIVDTWVS